MIKYNEGYIGVGKNMRFIPHSCTFESFSVVDLFFAMSWQRRWSGRKTPKWMNVLHHSIDCAKLVKEMGGSNYEIHYALFHDAAEAILGDIPGPVKTHIPDFKKYENMVLREIFACVEEELGIDLPFGPKPELVSVADYECCIAERKFVGGFENSLMIRHVIYWLESLADIELLNLMAQSGNGPRF